MRKPAIALAECVDANVTRSISMLALNTLSLGTNPWALVSAHGLSVHDGSLILDTTLPSSCDPIIHKHTPCLSRVKHPDQQPQKVPKEADNETYFTRAAVPTPAPGLE